MNYTYNINHTYKTALLITLGILFAMPQSANAGEAGGFWAGLRKGFQYLITPQKQSLGDSQMQEPISSQSITLEQLAQEKEQAEQLAQNPGFSEKQRIKSPEQLAEEEQLVEEFKQEFKESTARAARDTGTLRRAEKILKATNSRANKLKFNQARELFEQSHCAKCNIQSHLLTVLLTKPHFNKTPLSFGPITNARELALDYLRECPAPYEDLELQKKQNQRYAQEFSTNPDPSEEELEVMRHAVEKREQSRSDKYHEDLDLQMMNHQQQQKLGWEPREGFDPFERDFKARDFGRKTAGDNKGGMENLDI